jgi:hypothetical protein
MIVDCMSCPVRGQRCDDCAVTVLLARGSADLALPTRHSPAEPSAAELPLDVAESRAVSMFVGAGLVSTRTVPGLRARRETMEHWETQHWETKRDVG